MIFHKHATEAEKEIFSNLMWLHESVVKHIYLTHDFSGIDQLIKLTDHMARMAEKKPDIYSENEASGGGSDDLAE